MSQPRERQVCCCCPVRVDVKGTYKTIGSDTIDKFKAHARCTITKNVTRACNKCYKKYTKNSSTKVWQIVAQLPSMTSCTSHTTTHYPRMAYWATVCHSRKTHISFSLTSHNSTHWLLWLLTYSKIKTWNNNNITRYVFMFMFILCYIFVVPCYVMFIMLCHVMLCHVHVMFMFMYVMFMLCYVYVVSCYVM